MTEVSTKLFLDFDGTLVDIRPRHYAVYKRCVEYYKGKPLDIDTYWRLKRCDTSWVTILERSSLGFVNENNFLTYFIGLIEDVDMLKKDKLFDDALPFIESVSKDHDIYLVSLRRNHANLEEQVRSLGIDQKFKMILSGHSETRSGVLTKKADVIRAVGGYEGGIIIGDTEADIAASHQLNITSIALTTGVRDASLLTVLKPSHIANTLSEARGFIR